VASRLEAGGQPFILNRPPSGFRAAFVYLANAIPARDEPPAGARQR
jgi:hypothetical protein